MPAHVTEPSVPWVQLSIVSVSPSGSRSLTRTFASPGRSLGRVELVVERDRRGVVAPVQLSRGAGREQADRRQEDGEQGEAETWAGREHGWRDACTECRKRRADS